MNRHPSYHPSPFMKKILAGFSGIGLAVFFASLSGCALLDLDNPFCKRSGAKVSNTGSGKAVVPSQVRPKTETPKPRDPKVVLMTSDCAEHGILILYMGPYRGDRRIYFVGCTNYQKIPIDFGTQNISVNDGFGRRMAIYVPPRKNIFKKINDFWLRRQNYSRQLLAPTLTVDPEINCGGVVIVDASTVTNFHFDFAGQTCSAAFSENSGN